MNTEQLKTIFDQWQHALHDVIDMLLSSPKSDAEFWVFVIVGYLCCRLAFVKTAQSMNLNDLGAARFHVTTLIGLAGVLLPLTAVRIYQPDWYTSGDELFYVVGIIIGASLVISVPLINIMLRENYFKAVMAWGVGLLAIVASVVIVGVLSDAVFSGTAAYKKAYERNEDTQKTINYHGPKPGGGKSKHK